MESMESPRWIWEIYEQQAFQTPDAVAVKCCPQGATVTYRDVVQKCDSLARQLWNSSKISRSPKAGLRKLVAIYVDRTHPDFLPLLLAVGRCRWTFVLLSTDLPSVPRQRARNHWLLKTLEPELVIGCSAAELGSVQLLNLEALAGAPPSPDLPDLDGDPELMALMCTGGSQRLKIVQVTHEMMISEQSAYRCLASETTLPEFPRVLQQHRSFWPAAVLGQLSLAVALQGTSVHCSIESDQLRDTVVREQIDVIGLVPDQLSLLLEDLPLSLRLVISWAERLPPHLARRVGRSARLVEVLIATE